MIKLEKTATAFYLLIFIAVMLWIGLADYWDNKIQHDFPYSYLASDTFQHQTRAQWIKDTGNYKYEAPYYSAGYTDVIGFYPPILNHLAVLFSHVSGLEVYDTIVFLTVMLAIIGSLVFYLITRKLNTRIAIFALPLSIYIFTVRETKNAFFWGNWPALLGDFFLVATFWMMLNLKRDKTTFFLGLFLSGTILGHTAATVFAALFIITEFAVSILSKNLGLKELKIVAKGTILSIICSAYSLLIFKDAWLKAHPLKLASMVFTDWSGGGGFITLQHFGNVVLFVMTIGLLTLVFSKQENKTFYTTLGIFIILAGFTNYVGFTNRAFNFRFYWPIFLSIFFGIGIYKITKITLKKITNLKALTLGIIILLLLVKINYTPSQKVDGIMNPYTWQTLNWIKDHTEKDAKIFFFYGDPYDQDGLLGNTNRISTRVEIKDLLSTLQKRKIERDYPTKQLTEMGANFPYKKGFFKLGLHLQEDINATDRQIRDLCSFDYYVFDTMGRFEAFTQLNEIIATTFLKENFTMVFNNPLNIIIANNALVGKPCFGKNNSITF